MTNAMSLEGKRVIAIGGSSGIGFAVAALARERGAEVVIASSNPANVDAAIARLPGSSGRTVDLRDEAGVSRFFDQVGSFDHLAITAGDQGLPAFGATRDLDLAAAREALTLRFWGSLAAVKHGSRVIASNGSITLTGGLLAHRPQKVMPFVTAAAGAMESLARGLAVDLAPVRVNAVCPGLILTERVRQMPEERVRGYVAGLPLPRAASPDEAATAYVYLMLNGYVTGQTLAVDGGGLLV
ncbi:SDR family oxidoreductase [Bradyrhizobium uaiense]|nr:SDR family oxidoreductase [Bradyrhizobium uaiense]